LGSHEGNLRPLLEIKLDLSYGRNRRFELLAHERANNMAKLAFRMIIEALEA